MLIGETRMKKMQKKAGSAIQETLERPRKSYSPPRLVYLIGRIAVPLYSHVGVRIASLLRTWPLLRSAFRPLFDRALERAYREFANRAVSFPGQIVPEEQRQ